jgi:hypothetical protein
LTLIKNGSLFKGSLFQVNAKTHCLQAEAAACAYGKWAVKSKVKFSPWRGKAEFPPAGSGVLL